MDDPFSNQTRLMRNQRDNYDSNVTHSHHCNQQHDHHYYVSHDNRNNSNQYTGERQKLNLRDNKKKIQELYDMIELLRREY